MERHRSQAELRLRNRRMIFIPVYRLCYVNARYLIASTFTARASKRSASDQPARELTALDQRYIMTQLVEREREKGQIISSFSLKVQRQIRVPTKGADLSHPRRVIRTCSLRCTSGRVRGTTAMTSWGREGSDIDTLNRRTMSLVVLIKKRQDGPQIAASFAPGQGMRVCCSWLGLVVYFCFYISRRMNIRVRICMRSS